MNRGFTLIETVIVLAICGILIAITADVYQCKSNGKGCPSKHDPRMCSAGYVFVNSGRTQLLDENGHGIPCEGKR